MKKLFTLLTLALLSIGSAWAVDDISCSAYLSNTAGSPTVTDCTFKYFGQEGQAASNTPAGTASGTYYYSKMNSDKNYYEITLNKTVGGNDYTSFIAGDVITVYLYANGSTVAYKVGKTAQTAVSSSKTKGSVYGIEHTLTSEEIESDGTLRIYRNSSNTYFAGISVVGTRATEIYTVTFNAGANGTCGTASLTEANPGAGVTLPAVTPNSGYAFNGWFTAASDGTKVGDAGDTYNPTANITLYAQYLAQQAPGISIDKENPSTPRSIAVKFTAEVTGAPTPTVTWYQSATATNSGGTEKGTGLTYSPDVTTIGTYYYYAVASNGVGSDATSELITLTVTDPDVYRTGFNSYYLAKNDQPVGGSSVLCDDIIMVYDNVTYNKAGDDKMIYSLNANYVSSVTCSTNGWGVTFTPKSDGTLSVGVVINGSKTFSITNASSFDYNGKQDEGDNVTSDSYGTNASGSWTPSKKQYTIITLPVTSGTNYKFSVAGSKMSLYGFEFTPSGATATASFAAGKEYITFASPYALDCTTANLPAGLKAYKATGASASSVTIEEVNSTVAAGTGLLLQRTGDTSAAGNFDILAVASGKNISATNKLVGVTAAAGVAIGGEGVYDYVLKDAQFYHASAGTLAQGKAYLHLDAAPSAPVLNIDFGGTTGINEVQGSGVKVNGYYDLQGRRVAQPTKGLYIVNGKKFVIK